jgi:hypothetical protein
MIDLDDHGVSVMENKMRQIITVQSVKSEVLVSTLTTDLLNAA